MRPAGSSGRESDVMKVRNEYLAGYRGEGFGRTRAADSRRRVEAEFTRLKGRLLDQLLDSHDFRVHSILRRAMDDAAALAWTTPSPVLFLPDLLEENADEGLRYLDRQRLIWERFGGTYESAA